MTHSFGEVFAAVGRPRAATMLALGFASGLPFLLTGATFGFWLADEGITATAIGFLSWVGLAYSLKFVWSPLIDRLPAPFLAGLGRRRGWAVLTQVIVSLALVAIAIIGPKGQGGLMAIGALALVVAFASATQDIVLDAWRIEAASNADELGLFTSVFQLGYRAALLVSDALILIFAQHLGWPVSYGIMAVLMGVGLLGSFRLPEPARADAVMDKKAHESALLSARGLSSAIVGPFVQFFRTHGPLALLMLLMISVYRLPEFVIGPVAGPFYHDLGLSKDVIGGVRGSIGLIASGLGIAAGGVCAYRLGYIRTLILGALLQGIGVAMYAMLAYFGPDLRLFGLAMASDNFCYAFAGVALVTYMSSLTSIGYTATQYALLSSTYALLGKFLKGFSGAIVDALSMTHARMDAYALFYIGAGCVALPGLILCVILSTKSKATDAALLN